MTTTTTTTTTETYLGWTNRETWAMALMLGNEYATQKDLEDMAEQATSVGQLVRAMVDYWEDLETFAPDYAQTVRNEVGSDWRVNWVEIAQGYWEGRR